MLGLQEVDRGQPRSGGHDLIAVAAGAMGGEGRFAPAIIGTPGERWRAAADGDGPGRAGVRDRPGQPAAGARWPVTRLPSAPVRSPVLIPGRTRRVIWLRDEPRVLLAAVVDAPTGPMTVATTHLSFVPGWNGRSCAGWPASCAGCRRRGCCSATSTCPGRCRAG